MKGELALDMVVKFLIILVVAAIVIGLFMRFSGDSKNAVKDLFGPDKKKLQTDFPKTYEQSTFSPGGIAQYIESCYDALTEVEEVEQKDTVCYVLLADSDFSGFTSVDAIRSAVSAKIRQDLHFKTDLTQTHLKIEFKELGDEIIVS
ncbi:MAG: hypothetical protein JW727_01320 [Candidatus Aenigmarchaeota archaeon]|nr:hypothetical protein [Candidatus Aenigmarchaeota archaeon]